MVGLIAFLAIAGLVSTLALPGNVAIIIAFVMFGLIACLSLAHWAWLNLRVRSHTSAKRHTPDQA